MFQVEKTGENFRIIYDVKGRFTVHRITAQEAKYKLCKVREVSKSIYNLKVSYNCPLLGVNFVQQKMRTEESEPGVFDSLEPEL